MGSTVYWVEHLRTEHVRKLVEPQDAAFADVGHGGLFAAAPLHLLGEVGDHAAVAHAAVDRVVAEPPARLDAHSVSCFVLHGYSHFT